MSPEMMDLVHLLLCQGCHVPFLLLEIHFLGLVWLEKEVHHEMPVIIVDSEVDCRSRIFMRHLHSIKNVAGDNVVIILGHWEEDDVVVA